jgi:hypothetical protein
MTTASVKSVPPEAFEVGDPASIDHDDRLILWMLELTPAKRLEALQNFVDGVMVLRHARNLTQ